MSTRSSGLIAEIPAIDKHAARYGKESARQLFRTVHGRRDTDRPLELAEMDHTQLDRMVVNEKFLPMGRPFITACICSHTRNILGIHVGFSPPSFNSVAKCLMHCFLPKVHLREEYPDVKSEWAAFGLMEELVIDNGLEFHSHALEQACGSLGITLRYAARKQPWFKGKIERFLGTFNRAIAHGNPGTTFSNIFEKDDYDPSKHAVIPLSTLRTVVMKWIADVYHQEIHSSLQMSPAQKWASTVQLEDIRNPDETIDLGAVMSRRHERVLSHAGIEYEGLRFNSPELDALRRIVGARLKVTIGVDEDDLQSIFVFDTRSGKPLKVPCLSQDYAAGTSLFAHMVNKRAAPKLGISTERFSALLEAKKKIQELIEESLTSTRRTSKRQSRYEQGTRKQLTARPVFPGHLGSPLSAVDALAMNRIETEHFAPPSASACEPLVDRETRKSGLKPISRRREAE